MCSSCIQKYSVSGPMTNWLLSRIEFFALQVFHFLPLGRGLGIIDRGKKGVTRKLLYVKSLIHFQQRQMVHYNSVMHN